MIREISLYSINSRLTDIHPLEKLSLTIISLIGASYINNNYILSVNILFFIILNILSKNPKSIINKFPKDDDSFDAVYELYGEAAHLRLLYSGLFPGSRRSGDDWPVSVRNYHGNYHGHADEADGL